MGLYDNSPSFSYVRADGIAVVWNEELYMVQSFNTNKKYIYWNADMPNQLNASNVFPARTNKQYLVIINDNGISTQVPSPDDNFSISYDSNSTEAIKDRIYGLYEKDSEYGDRFVVIEQDISGLKQIVGEGGVGGGEHDHDSIWEKISIIEQRADGIDLSVSELTKDYNDNKEMSKLREELNGSIIKLNSDLGTFKNESTDYFKDSQITDEEKTKIETQIDIISGSKSEVVAHVNKVLLIADSEGMNEDVTALESSITALNQAHDNLDSLMKNVISDRVITPSDRTIIIDAFAKYSLRINLLKGTVDDIILLGLGGVITEELAKISMKSDEIRLSVEETISSFKSDVSIAKIEANKQVEDVNKAVANLEATLKEGYKDGEVSQVEIDLINEKITVVSSEKLDIGKLHLENSEGEYISNEFKQDLDSKYETYNNKHDEIISAIGSIIGDGFVNDAEKISLENLIKEYYSCLSNYSNSLIKAIENVGFNKANIELQKAKDELKAQIDEVTDSVKDLDEYIDDTFKNNLLDEAEKQAISQNLTSLNTEKTDIDNRYNDIYANENLIGQDKIDLKNSYDYYVLKYNEIVDVVNGILNKETLIDDLDRANLLSAFVKHDEVTNSYK